MKIIDKIQPLVDSDSPFFSFEFFPPKTDDGVINLFQRLDRMALMAPIFIDVTWGAGGSTADRTLEICKSAQNIVSLDTMMHLTCTNMPAERLTSALQQARDGGLKNILALRGDPPRGEEWKQVDGGLAYAVDLVRFVRKEHGDHFGIAVAGYPEGHIDSEDKSVDVGFLKAKIDAGADFVITQLFYDVDLYLEWLARCREMGIKCPIIPGIMPIHSYAGFVRMTTLSKTKVPQEVRDILEPIKDNEEAVKEYGIHLTIENCKKLLNAGVRGFHFYTLNLERSVTKIVQGLGFVSDIARPLPWKTTPSPKNRSKEDVRPVFWLYRPKSYILRTNTWDEFPNGRWGDSRSPAFGDLADYHLASQHISQKEVVERRLQWGESPSSLEEISNTFVRYCKGEIASLPWNDMPISAETKAIQDKLIKLNQNGFLTINSQPRVNGVPSTDPVYGWGDKHGFIFQKAYIEFFVSAADFKRFQEKLVNYPMLTFHAVNRSGTEVFGNTKSTNALTWGVFVGQEIKQPTVVDHDSFMVWKDEAFSLWHAWAVLYEKNSAARTLIESVQNSFYLFNIVDNDFINGDIFKLFDEVIAEKTAQSA